VTRQAETAVPIQVVVVAAAVGTTAAAADTEESTVAVVAVVPFWLTAVMVAMAGRTAEEEEVDSAGNAAAMGARADSVAAEEEVAKASQVSAQAEMAVQAGLVAVAEAAGLRLTQMAEVETVATGDSAEAVVASATRGEPPAILVVVVCTAETVPMAQTDTAEGELRSAGPSL
jgi:hypothetical protein